jgi:hypothetical protein
VPGYSELVDEGDSKRLEYRLGMDAAALTGDQHLRARRSLGVGQIAVLFDDQRPAQRNHHEDAHQAARDRQDRDARDVEIVAHQQNRGDREDDPRRDRVRRRAGGLDDVVFEDGGAAEPAEDRDRENGNRDRCADGEPDLQREVHVRGTEDQPEHDSQHDGANSQLGRRLGCRDVGLVGCARDGGRRCGVGRWAVHRGHNLRPGWRGCPGRTWMTRAVYSALL